MSSPKCVLCREQSLEKIFYLENSPRYAQKLLHTKDIKNREKSNVSLYKCKNCQMVQINTDELSQDEYFEDYLMSRSCTELYTEYDKTLAKEFVSKFNLKGKRVIEIGCGDGYFAERLIKEGAIVEAIEPSKTACEIVAKRGVHCYNTFLDESVDRYVHQKYDAFVSKQVIDLVKEPNAFLKNLAKILKPEAKGLIDAPSWTKTLLDRRYYDILPDRVSYFTALTLTRMMEQNNFHVMEVHHVADDEYVLAYACYEAKKEGLLSEFKQEFNDFKKDFLEMMQRYESQKKTVVAWGAGAKGASLLSFSGMDSKRILYVIDKDPHKNGLYLPGSLLKIVSPETLNGKKQPSAIIITAAMFYKEITKELLNKYKYKGDIVLLTPKPHVLAKGEIQEILGKK